MDRVMPIAITRAVPADRTRDLGLLFGLLAWLVYTKFFFTLRAGHLVLPPCPFYYLTGHPCPFCGGTRSFAYMWEGDIADSVRLFPLGPAFFVGALLGAGGLASGIVSGRSLSRGAGGALVGGVTAGGGVAHRHGRGARLVCLGKCV